MEVDAGVGLESGYWEQGEHSRLQKNEEQNLKASFWGKKKCILKASPCI